MSKTCPFCGQQTLQQRSGEYQFTPPDNVPGGAIVVAKAHWFECTTCGEAIIPDELSRAIESERIKRLGLLTPVEIKSIRERTGLTALAMAQCLGVGDKTYTRWENGKSLQNKANDTLIRILDKNVELVAIVNAERDPHRDVFIRGYFTTLSSLKGNSELAMAAHGADLGIVARRGIIECLKAIRSKGKALA